MSKKILVVDDEHQIVNLLEKYFTKKGFEVTTVLGVAEALISLEGQSYDLIISDYRMQDGTGVDLFKQLKDQKHFILLSGFIDIEKKQIHEMGIAYFMEKPIFLKKLDELVQQVIAA